MVVSYHVSSPWSGDPFYQDNIIENTARKDFYGISAVPRVRLDGWIVPTYPYNQSNLEAALGQAQASITSVTINLSGTYDTTSRGGTGTIAAEIIAEDAQSGSDLRVVMVICEDGIPFTTPNGLNDHFWVMRDMLPDATATPVTFSGPYPDSVTVSQGFVIAPGWDENNCYVAAFLQDFGGAKKIEQGIRIQISDLAPSTLAVDLELARPSRIALGQNFPNPCNPTTVFPVSITEEGPVSLTIYDVGGKRVREVFAARLSPGFHNIDWDGRDAGGQSVASGIYYARFEAMQQVQARKLVVIR